MTPEAQIEQRVLRALGRDPAVLLLRNEVGRGFRGTARAALDAALEPWGKLAQQAAQAALNRHVLQFGLGVGSTDLVGIVAADPWPVPIALELKSADGRLSEDQKRWHAAACRRGLLVSTVRSEDDAMAAIDAAKLGCW